MERIVSSSNVSSTGRRVAARTGRRVAVGVVSLLLAAAAAPAQERWSWPERAENLQQLPEDFPPERLRAVMTGFTRALGVRCSHCHVGEEGQPLSTYDFPSDDNPKKVTARGMLAMLGTINDQLDEIRPKGPEPVNMWCHTCHRGRPRPATLDEELAAVHQAEGVEAMIAHYRDLRARFHGRGAYDFGERTLNALGYGLLGAGQHDDAIAVFRLNAEQFPDSGNVWDSLAEAYLKAGHREQAIVFYQKSLELDPGNANAAARLGELRGALAAPEPDAPEPAAPETP